MWRLFRGSAYLGAPLILVNTIINRPLSLPSYHVLHGKISALLAMTPVLYLVIKQDCQKYMADGKGYHLVCYISQLLCLLWLQVLQRRRWHLTKISRYFPKLDVYFKLFWQPWSSKHEVEFFAVLSNLPASWLTGQIMFEITRSQTLFT